MDTSRHIIQLIDLSLGEYTVMGGKGSGNWGHKGRRGKRGGSAPGHGAAIRKLDILSVGSKYADISSLFEIEREVLWHPMEVADDAVPSRSVVDLDKLLFMESEVSKQGVERYIRDPSDKPIKVVKKGGILYVWDGQHRAVANKLLGHNKIAADIYVI